MAARPSRGGQRDPRDQRRRQHRHRGGRSPLRGRVRYGPRGLRRVGRGAGEHHGQGLRPPGREHRRRRDRPEHPPLKGSGMAGGVRRWHERGHHAAPPLQDPAGGGGGEAHGLRRHDPRRGRAVYQQHLHLRQGHYRGLALHRGGGPALRGGGGGGDGVLGHRVQTGRETGATFGWPFVVPGQGRQGRGQDRGPGCGGPGLGSPERAQDGLRGPGVCPSMGTPRRGPYRASQRFRSWP